ncbi:MAG: bile acid:sodium symporter [Bacteroidales bacterium]|nr:bile acid:sodium symporter [Bacteroidales bacterium]
MQSLFSAYLLPFSLSVIMVGMGLSLERQDFTNIIRYPRSIFVGVISQIIVLPVITFLIFYFTHLDPLIKVGFILITACAGGSATNIITHMLRGNLALSISLTALNSFLILISLPVIVKIALIVFVGESQNIELSIIDTVLNILLTIIIPTFIGMWVRHNFPTFAQKSQKPLRIILPLILFSVFAIMLIIDDENSSKTTSHYLFLIPWALLLNFISMFVVYIFSRLMKLNIKKSMTISVEVGLKNSIVGIFVAETLLKNHEIAMVSVIYGSITFFSTLLFGFLEKRIELLSFRFRN